MSSKNQPSGRNDIGELSPCDCGGVNLILGPMTLHLAPEEIPQLFELVAAAVDLSVSLQQKASRRSGGKSRAHGHTLH